jgi:hypothetical protein
MASYLNNTKVSWFPLRMHPGENDNFRGEVFSAGMRTLPHDMRFTFQTNFRLV